jgi:hypothetical protein
MMPGTMNLFASFTTSAPAGMETRAAGPISRMRPPSITIVTSFCGAAPVPSITVAPVRTVVCADVVPAKTTAAANTAIRQSFM